uniref:Glypican 5a n=1 Tax=Cynoglossus semilaevis TaxID=244447 RepID=A0A3P8V8U9_CYNSE
LRMATPAVYFLFLLSCCCGIGSCSECDDIRKVFQLRQSGLNELLPSSPRPGTDLQICKPRNLTCCTKKIEGKYQLVVQSDIQNLLQTSSTSLKLLISSNVAAFQETFEDLMRQAENHTDAVLQRFHYRIAHQVAGPLGEFFSGVGLFLLGSELSMDELVLRFFEELFPLVYDHLLNPGAGETSAGYTECVRSSTREVAAFGRTPADLSDQISRSGASGKLLLQALHLGIEVINTTDHLQLSRECRRALLKMNYCPHCQGLTRSNPCMGYCLNVMRGCLASLAEIDVHWREFVRSLEGLSARMQESQDLEQVLLGVHGLIHDAVGYAQKNGPRLSAQVHKLCGPPIRKPTQMVSIQQSKFLTHLRHYRTYYGGLADQLCVSNLVLGDGLSCWNGTDVVKSYTLRVVGNGIKAQSVNPEVKVKEADPVIHQIIDKLKHVNQLLQGKSIPKLGSLDQIEAGSGDSEGRYSGDCDDEDGCAGSGGGEVKGKTSRVSKSKAHRYFLTFDLDLEYTININIYTIFFLC